MRTLAALAVVALLAVSLAGCSSDDPERYPDGVPSGSPSASRSTTGSATATGSSTATGTSGPGGEANHPPSGAVEVVVNGTLATFNLTGTDADNDTLSWALSYGDGNATNGTTLPATVQHNYTAGGNLTGNLTVRFTLTDGKDPVTYNVTLNLTAGGGRTLFAFTASTTQTGNPFTSDGGLAGPQPGLGARACAGFMAGEDGVDCVFAAFTGLDGKTYSVVTDADTPDLEFWDACDPGMGTVTQVHGGALAGPVPAGSGCVVLWNFGTATATFTFTVTG